MVQSTQNIIGSLPFAEGSAVKAGLVYFVSVFAIGFILGMIRIPFLAPLFGDLNAVLIELPIILSMAWLICLKLVRTFYVPSTIGSRLVMGGVALVILLIAELTLSTLVFDKSIIEHLQSYLTAPHALGLAGQCAFGLFPAIQLVLRDTEALAIQSED